MSGLRRLSASAPSTAGALGGQLLIFDAVTGKYLPGANPSTPTNILPLQRARMALAASDTTPCHWLALGDSVTEGTGAATNYRDNRYITRLLRLLQKRHMSAGTGGIGFIGLSSEPAAAGTSQGSAAWTRSGGSLTGTDDGSLVSGATSLAANETATLTLSAATSIDVYSDGQSPWPTQVKYTVNGGATQTMTFAARPGGYIPNGSYKVGSITLGTSGAYTIVFSPPNVGDAMLLAGAMVYNGDEGKGIRLWPGGHYGTTTTSYLASGGIGQASAMLQFAANVLPTTPPALVTILLGFNDFGGNVVPATFQANLQALIANVKTAFPTVTPSFLLMTPYEAGSVTSPTYPWTQYVASCNAVAAADPNNVASISFTDRILKPVAGNNYANGMCLSDALHPSTSGHWYMAEALDALLAPA